MVRFRTLIPQCDPPAFRLTRSGRGDGAKTDRGKAFRPAAGIGEAACGWRRWPRAPNRDLPIAFDVGAGSLRLAKPCGAKATAFSPLCAMLRPGWLNRDELEIGGRGELAIRADAMACRAVAGGHGGGVSPTELVVALQCRTPLVEETGPGH